MLTGIVGCVAGIILSYIPYLKKQRDNAFELTDLEKETVSQIIHATKKQNELFSQNMDLMTEHRAKIITAAFDKAMAYNNVIVTLGYAALFTMLTFTKDSLPENVFILAYLLAGFSVILYTAFTIYSIIFNLKEVNHQVSTLAAETIDQFFIGEVWYTKEKILRLGTYFKIWNIVFWINVIAGFSSASIVIFYNTLNLLAV